MAYTTVNKSKAHQSAVLYTGNGASSQTITGVGHQPDLVWIKSRSDGANHQLQDAVRGKSGSNYQYVQMDTSSSQGVQGDSDGVNSLDADGFKVGYTNSTAWNENAKNYVSWNWKANGAGSANTDGTINTTSTSVNTTAGTSIITFTGNGTSGATIGHGLGAKPHCFFIKNTTAGKTENFVMYHHIAGATKRFKIRASSRSETASTAYWNDTEPTSSVISLGNDNGVNLASDTYVVYAFTQKAGFSKFGQYEGNGSSNGPVVYTGFKPQSLIICRRDSDDEIEMYDDVRAGYNSANYHLNMDLDHAEAALSDRFDLLSNGFKLRAGPSGPINTDAKEYLYLAWGQSIVGTNNVPATAR